jgi:uncharacterized membrane protein YkoI
MSLHLYTLRPYIMIMSHNIRTIIVLLTAIALAVGTFATTTFDSGAVGQTISSSKSATTTTIISGQGKSLNQKNSTNATNITGSIPLRSTIGSALFSQVKITLSQAILTAQQEVGSNSSATSAFMRPLKGYLVYDIHVRNNSNNTSYAVIVDPGDGKILYKQALPSYLAGHQPMLGKYRGSSPFHEGH